MNWEPLTKPAVKPNPFGDKASSIALKTENSLIMLGYRQTQVGLVASLFCSLIIFIGLNTISDKSALTIWFGVSLLATLLRSLLVVYYKHDPDPSIHLVKWRRLYVVSALLGGILWGVTGLLFYPQADNLQQTLIIFVLAGTTAGSVPLYSAVVAAGRTFLVTALIPLAMVLTISNNHTNFLLNITLLGYLIYLLALCQRSYNSMKYSISLQFENHNLLNNLSEAKHQLEMINKKLEQAATHDPLTNVANRNLFGVSFSQAIERAKVSKKLLALLYIDLDNFKNINDVYGHHVGDQLLLILTERMEEFIEAPNIISRLGGDEFTILIENVTNPNEVAKLAKKICHSASDSVKIGNLELKVSVSIGIGVYPIDGDDAEKLLYVADKAMYYIKERGGNNFRFNVTLLTGKL
jgi:diguanylate cyclase (GGDEF)-like protein